MNVAPPEVTIDVRDEADDWYVEPCLTVTIGQLTRREVLHIHHVFQIDPTLQRFRTAFLDALLPADAVITFADGDTP